MRRAGSGLALCLVLLAAAARADVGRVGPELPVSTDPNLPHHAAAVGADAGGRFVITWTSGGYYYGSADGSGDAVFARRFDANGAPAGAAFQVNAYTFGPQRDARVAVAPDGEFVVAWSSGDYYLQGRTQDGSATGVFVQRFAADGEPLGGELQANTYTRGNQRRPDVAIDAAGNFVVVWTSGDYYTSQDGHRDGVFGQRFAPTGAPQGSEFQVNTATAGRQREPAVDVVTPGGFVVAWESGGLDADGDGFGIFGQRFDAAGARTGGEFQVNTYTTGDQYSTDVAGRPDGSFVVVWQNGYYGGSPDGDASSVSARLFAADGTPLGPQFEVNTYTRGPQSEPQVAVDGDGNFVVTWRSGNYYGGNPDGDSAAIRAQHFSRAGVRLGGEVQVNTYTTGAQVAPAIAATGNGGFVITWDDYYGGAAFSRDAVYAQRFVTTGFAPPIALAGTTLALKDAPDPARRKLAMTARDSDVAFGGLAGSIDDPTIHGGSLRVRSATFDDTYLLPAAHWRAIGPGLGYEYRDPKRLAGPIVRVRLRAAQVLDVRGKGAGLGHTLATNPRPVAMQLQLGTVGQRSCMVFADGAYAFRPGRSFKATQASAPAACP